MNKSDLRTGMKVLLRNGDEYMVLCNFASDYRDYKLKDGIVFLSDSVNCWNDARSYDNCLENETDKSLDIMKVFSPVHPYSVSSYFGVENTGSHEYTLVWERYEVDENLMNFADYELGKLNADVSTIEITFSDETLIQLADSVAKLVVKKIEELKEEY
ncbi:MAG TPA: hypothetical protein DDY71_11225 [Spirochaetia bacterium]|nr:hypothetical protein [Spirochaetia bacterium]